MLEEMGTGLRRTSQRPGTFGSGRAAGLGGRPPPLLVYGGLVVPLPFTFSVKNFGAHHTLVPRGLLCQVLCQLPLFGGLDQMRCRSSPTLVVHGGTVKV